MRLFSILLYLSIIFLNTSWTQTCPMDNQSAFIDFTVGGECPSQPITVEVSSMVNQDTGDACCFVDNSANNNTCTSISVVVPSGTCIRVSGSSQSATDWFYTWDSVNECQNGVDLDANQDYEITLPDPSGTGVFEVMYCKNGNLSSADITVQNVACCDLDVMCPATPPADISCADSAPEFITDVSEFDITATNPLDGSSCLGGLTFEIKSAVDNPDPADPMSLACSMGGSDVEITRTYTIGTLSDTDCIADVSCTQTYMILADCCCEFSATCPANTDLGTYNCTNLGTIPAAPTNLASIMAAPYNIVVGTSPCGTILVESNDDISIPSDICDISMTTTITRTVLVFDDTGDGAGGPANGVLDADEESQECTYMLTIENDGTAPMPTCPTNVITGLDCNTTALPNSELTLAGTDNCGATSFTVTNVSDDALPTSFCVGDDLSINRVYTVEDDCGNEAMCTQTFTFLPDNIPPTITCPPDIITGLECGDPIPLIGTIDDFISAGGFIIDNCSSDFTISSVITPPGGVSELNYCTADVADRTITEVFSIRDDCGNTSMCTRMYIFDGKPIPNAGQW